MSLRSNLPSGLRLTAFLLGAMLLGVLLIAATVERPNPPMPSAAAGKPEAVPHETAILTAAPQVPPPLERSHPAHVIIHLEVQELTGELANGVEYHFSTFGGQVPGKFIRVRQGDWVEFHLHNPPENKLSHSIDLHALTGPGGGAPASLTAPGRSSQFSFRALNPGLFVYHSATAPVGINVANGLYGLILVEPAEGLPPVDREYYIMQGEFYTTGAYGEQGLQAMDVAKAIAEQPSYVVFNGAVGSLLDERALTARTGETVRLYVGNAGPNLISSFRVIGEIFDAVYQEGGTRITQQNVQATLIPAGGSAMVEFKVEVPGTYLLVDNSLFRAFHKGALAMLKVEGSQDLALYSGKQSDLPYPGRRDEQIVQNKPAHDPGGGSIHPPLKVAPENVRLTKSQMEQGRKVYLKSCFVCHQPDGTGLPGVFPPLAKSDYLMADKERSIRIVIEGQAGEIVVNGTKYNGIMPPVPIPDQQVADVLTYVRNSWGNSGSPVTVEEVRRVRAELRGSTAFLQVRD
jgi:nitrite reductase (NO-forming)